MSMQAGVSGKGMSSSLQAGANTVVLAGVGLVGYGLMFFIRTFNGLIELGLTPAMAGGSPEEIQAFSPNLYHYISHLQVALSGAIIALGLGVIALAFFGIRRGETWTIWTAFLAPAAAVVIGLPLHYSYGFATLGHLGLIYLDAAILLVGTVMSLRGVRA